MARYPNDDPDDPSLFRTTRRRLMPLALTFAMLGVFPAAAEEATQVSFAQLVSEAIAENPRVRSLEATIRSSEARVHREGALSNPMVSYRAEDLEDAHRVMLAQEFPFPGKRGALRAVAEQETEALRWELVALRNEIAAEIAASMFDLHLLYAEIEVLDDAQGQLRLFADLARTRYRVGIGAQDDYLRATMELSEVTAKSEAARARLRAQTVAVNLILGRDPQAPLHLPEWSPAPTPVLGPDDLATLALEVSPALRARERTVAGSEAAVEVARVAGRPDFSVGLGWMWMSTLHLAGEHGDVREERENGWMGEVAVGLPLWRGSNAGPAKGEAEASLAATRAAHDAARNDVLREVEEAYARFAAAEIDVARYRDVTLPQARLAVESNRAAYEHGRAEFSPLIEASRAERGYLLEQQAAGVEREKALAEVARAVGDMSLLLGEAAE